MGQIGIVPINTIDSGFLTRLALCLEERFLFTCTVERTLRVPRSALNGVRKQMFLNTLVTRLVASTQPLDGLRLAITDFDLYKISHRLRNDFYGEKNDDNLLFQRTLKEAVHDLGHALGLKHCFNARCAMYFSNSIFDTDNKLSHFCETCEKRIRASR